MRFVRRGRGRPEDAPAIRGLTGRKMNAFMFRAGRECNLSCSHCYTDSGPGRPRAGPETALQALGNLRRLVKMEKTGVGINGGEPLMNPGFVAAVAERARSMISSAGGMRSRMPIATNGTVFSGSVAGRLSALKDSIILLFPSDRFHRKPSKIREAEAAGFETYETSGNYPIAALGRGYSLKDANWKTACDAAGIRYVAAEGKLEVAERKLARHAFAVSESGELYLCGYGGIPFADLARQDTFEIAEDLAWSERAMEFITNGPIGLAALEGKEREAIEIFLERGSCGVCYALAEGII